MKMFKKLTVVVSLLASAASAAASEVPPTQLPQKLSEIAPMPVYYRTNKDKNFEIIYLSVYYKPHPAIANYPFLQVETVSKCVDTNYNPTGLIVSAITFPMAAVSNGGFWKASAGTTTCKEDSKIETKVFFKEVLSLKEKGKEFEVNCGTDTETTNKCRSFIDSTISAWNKNLKILSVKDDMETNKQAIAIQYGRIKQR